MLAPIEVGLDFPTGGGGVLGVGLDLVEVDRFRRALDRHGARLFERLFTEEEQAYCGAAARPWVHYAARFAAKEAASKAFGTGIGSALSWRSVSVSRDSLGKPIAVLDAQAQQLLDSLGGRTVLLSLTHTATLAQAIALVVR